MKWVVRLAIAVIIFYGTFTYARQNMKEWYWLIILPAIGLLSFASIVFSEMRGYAMHPMAYVGGLLCTILGLIIGSLIGYNFLDSLEGGIYIFFILNVIFGYLGYSIGVSWGKELGNLPVFARKKNTGAPRSKILDTSVIIDGRIPDICATGFIEGKIIVPQFVLNELQHIADSIDGLKRARGRRGLDILNKLQSIPNIKIEISEIEYSKVKEVDSKLISLAKELDADILTNDFNLNKVAQIRGVNVLNINLLANAIKPIVLPGETLTVTVTKQGKEKGQGVAYLDDGTMVVIEQGESLLNTEVEAVVTSILQTPAGRMIFASSKNGNQ
jgi:uncharacterized protein YacL